MPQFKPYPGEDPQDALERILMNMQGGRRVGNDVLGPGQGVLPEELSQVAAEQGTRAQTGAPDPAAVFAQGSPIPEQQFSLEGAVSQGSGPPEVYPNPDFPEAGEVGFDVGPAGPPFPENPALDVGPAAAEGPQGVVNHLPGELAQGVGRRPGYTTREEQDALERALAAMTRR